MKLHKQWLIKAEHDLMSSEVLIQAGEHLFDIAIYHTQQCAEKSLKALLVFWECEIEKTHNLVYLLSRCKEMDADFILIEEEAVFLNPFGTLYRYPEGNFEPTAQAVQKALECAKKIYLFVLNKTV